MAVEGRRAFVAQIAAGVGVAVLEGCNGRTAAERPLVAASTIHPAPKLPETPVLDVVLRGTVLALRYRFSKFDSEKLAGAPWAATLLVAIHPPSGFPVCRSLASGSLRTKAPVPDQGVLRAEADVDLAVFFNLQPPFVRYVHASFLHIQSDVLRVAAG